MTTTCPICTMVKDEDNVICEDCNTKGLIEHGIQILKNQEIAGKWNKVVGGHGLLTTPEEIWKWKEKAEKNDELLIEYRLRGEKIHELFQIKEHLKKEFEYYDIAFKKHKDIDDFKIAQVLSKILKGGEK